MGGKRGDRTRVRRGAVRRYADARTKWAKAGKPTRTDEDVFEILNQGCKPCPYYQALTKNLGRCKKCGCAVNLGKTLNKLFFATEECPAEGKEKRFLAKVIFDENGLPIENPDYSGVINVEQQVDQEPPPLTRRQKRLLAKRQKRIAEQQKEAEKQVEEKLSARQRRSAERRKKIELLGKINPAIEFAENTDPLLVCDRNMNPAGNAYRDLWKMQPAFLVCGGPSLNLVDLTKMADPWVCSIGVNNAAAYAPVKAFVYSDPTEKFHNGIFFNPTLLKFVPKPKLVPKVSNQVRAKRPDGTFEFTSLHVKNCPSVVGFERNSDWNPETFLTSEYASWGCSKRCPELTGRDKVLFTPFLALRLLHYLGVRCVYLLGVDFSMRHGTEGGYAFNQDRTYEAAAGNNQHYRIVNGMLTELRPFLEKAGFHVYNCNRESHLSAFDYVSFDNAIEHCKDLKPEEPWDLSGWYEKAGEKDREVD